MSEMLRLKLIMASLAAACVVFGGLTARKGIDMIRGREADGTSENRAWQEYPGFARSYGAKSIGLGGLIVVLGVFLFKILFSMD